MEFKIIANDVMDETLYYAKHKTGLDIFILPKKEYHKCHAMFATRYGSVENKFKIAHSSQVVRIPDGTAHFLEHKLFEEQDGNVFDKFSLLGASANAFTSFDKTAYHFSTTSNFLESLEVLIKFVQNPYFTPESIAKEQGIIGQEIKMYDDEPGWRVYFNLLDCLYHNNNVKYDIAGTVESIAGIHDKTLYDTYNTFYHPSNMVLFVCGDVDVNSVGECIEASLKDVDPLSPPERIYPDEPDSIHLAYKEQELDVAIPMFCIGFKDTDMSVRGQDLLKKEIETSVLLELLFGKSTSVYKKLYDQGLINDSFDFDYDSSLTYAFSILEGESKNPKDVYQIIANYLDDVIITAEDCERAKRVVWGEYVRAFNSTERITSAFVGEYFKGVNFFDFKEVYQQIDLCDILNRFHTHFTRNNMALSVVLPISEGEDA